MKKIRLFDYFTAGKTNPRFVKMRKQVHSYEVRSIRQGPYAVFTAPYSLNTVYQLKWTSLTSCEVMYRCSLIPYAVCSALRTEHVRSLRIGISLKCWK